MFKQYLPIEYICIDIANCFGLDKLLFEDRIQWVKDHVNELEELADKADDKPLYLKAVHALRETQAGKPTGHLIALDATCSGIQIMSAITGCVKGADATGLVSNKRADAYTDVTKEMNNILRLRGLTTIETSRNDVKRAVMTSGYGSTLVPKEVFGEGDMLDTFYKAAFTIAPAAFQLMNDLLNTWRPHALSHNWVMPDNFHVNIKVMQKKETRIEVDELNHATFTTYVQINQGSEKGLSNVANTIHSIDGYLLRSLIRRASFKPKKVKNVLAVLENSVKTRYAGLDEPNTEYSEDLQTAIELCYHSGMVDVAIIDYITETNVHQLSTEHIVSLIAILRKMLELGSSPVLTVHDAFRAHANHCNAVRYWYKELMAELAESKILQFIVSQILQQRVTFTKKSNNLGDLIRESNYAIC